MMLAYRERLQRLSSRTITPETLAAMHQGVREAKADWAWVGLVSEWVHRVRSKDYFAEAKHVFNLWHHLIWVSRDYRYQKDPHQVELVESPWHLIDRKSSDCDGWSTFYAAAVGALGHAYRFVTICADPTRPESPSHVYPQVQIEGRWITADLTVEEASFGWEPKGFVPQLWPEPSYS
jgi:hypothetical protein